MRLFVLLAAGVLILASIVAEWIIADPGYVLLAYRGTSFETSLWVGIALLAAAVFALVGLVYLIWRLVLSMGVFRQWAQRRKSQRLFRQSTSGTIAYIEGHWERSRRLLENAVKDAEAPLLSYMAAADVCNKMGDYDGTQRYLQLAEQRFRGAHVAVELTQAKIQIDNGQYESALATLQRCGAEGSKHPIALQLLRRVYEAMSDNEGLKRLLPALIKLKLVDKDAQHDIEDRIYSAEIEAIALGEDADTNLQALKAGWKAIPAAMRKRVALIRTYALRLKAADNEAEAELLLRDYIRKHWDEDLVALYGTLEAESPVEQRVVAEAWLKEQPGNPAVLLSLGRICVRAGELEDAERYLQACLEAGFNSAACAELGRVLALQGDPEQGNEYLVRALSGSSSLLPVVL